MSWRSQKPDGPGENASGILTKPSALLVHRHSGLTVPHGSRSYGTRFISRHARHRPRVTGDETGDITVPARYQTAERLLTASVVVGRMHFHFLLEFLSRPSRRDRLAGIDVLLLRIMKVVLACAMRVTVLLGPSNQAKAAYWRLRVMT